jgi:hypothetical protein
MSYLIDCSIAAELGMLALQHIYERQLLGAQLLYLSCLKFVVFCNSLDSLLSVHMSAWLHNLTVHLERWFHPYLYGMHYYQPGSLEGKIHQSRDYLSLLLALA